MIAQDFPPERLQVRSVFVSDLHLGCRHSQAGQFLRFLESIEAENIYLVGDIIDGWKLYRNSYWTQDFANVLDRLVALSEAGTAIRYAIGNHDDFLRASQICQRLSGFGLAEFAEEFVHLTSSGQRYLVLHGDRFDVVEQGAKWVSRTAAILYGGLLKVNKLWRWFRRNKQSYRDSFSARVKQRVKRIVQHISDFEDQLVMYARSRECDGVICGHIHTPKHGRLREIDYCNTGDWVENCTALIERLDGQMQLIYWDGRSSLDDLQQRASGCLEGLNLSVSDSTEFAWTTAP